MSTAVSSASATSRGPILPASASWRTRYHQPILTWLPTTEVGRIGNAAFMIDLLKTNRRFVSQLAASSIAILRDCPYGFLNPFELSEHRGAFLKKSLAPLNRDEIRRAAGKSQRNRPSGL